ncbi:MAG: efflux RND transporter periplasmic adaptor subunit [Burkholderiales bacterium]|nr:efflux RND transporter periplasmic adaptor subunit [Burkholderiales bacterium]
MMTQGISGAVAILALAAAMLAGCGERSESANADAKHAAKGGAGKDDHDHAKEEKASSDAIKLTDAQIAAAGIKVEALAPATVRNRIVVPAEIQPNQDRIAHVTPRIAGRIVKAPAALGERVRAGQTLALLDSIELGDAQSAYLQAASRFATARADFERAEGLNRDQIISQKEYLRIRSEFQQSGAALRAAEDKLRLLGVPPPAATDRATSVFPLLAPFAGTVIEKDAVLGELATPEKTLFTVADLTVLWVQAALFEKDLAMVRVGAPAEITVTAYPNELFRGRVAYIGEVFDKQTRTVRARIEVENKDARLKPDMFAHASIEAGGTSEALLLPQEAVVLMQGQPTVYVEDAHGFEPRPVQLGARYGGRVAIEGGVAAGDLVVTAGAYALKARALKSQLGSGHVH